MTPSKPTIAGPLIAIGDPAAPMGAAPWRLYVEGVPGMAWHFRIVHGDGALSERLTAPQAVACLEAAGVDRPEALLERAMDEARGWHRQADPLALTSSFNWGRR